MGFNDIDIKVSGGSDIISTLKTYTTRILKPNIVDGKNVLTQEMLNSKNTKYVIKYVYELLDATLTMPQNVILEFDGGSIKNGTLVGNDTLMLNTNETKSVLDNVTLDGTWKESSYDLVEEVVADKAPGDGMGRIILRKDKTFAEQLTQENTIYVIRYDFELTKDVTIPENCVLQFEGGSLNGNSLVVSNCKINNGIFNDTNIVINGSFYVHNSVFNNPNKIVSIEAGEQTENIKIDTCKFIHCAKEVTSKNNLACIYARYYSNIEIVNCYFEDFAHSNTTSASIVCTFTENNEYSTLHDSAIIENNTFINNIFGGNSAVHVGENHIILALGNDNVSIKNNHIIDCTIIGYDGELIYTKSKNGNIDDNYIKGNSGGEGIICCKSLSEGLSTYINIKNNTIYSEHNYAIIRHYGSSIIEGNNIESKGGYLIDTTSGFTGKTVVKNNIINLAFNPSEVSTLFGTTRTPIYCNNSQSDLSFENNYINASGLDRIFIQLRNNDKNISFYNNDFVINSTLIEVTVDSQALVERNNTITFDNNTVNCNELFLINTSTSTITDNLCIEVTNNKIISAPGNNSYSILDNRAYTGNSISINSNDLIMSSGIGFIYSRINNVSVVKNNITDNTSNTQIVSRFVSNNNVQFIDNTFNKKPYFYSNASEPIVYLAIISNNIYTTLSNKTLLGSKVTSLLICNNIFSGDNSRYNEIQLKGNDTVSNYIIKNNFLNQFNNIATFDGLPAGISRYGTFALKPSPSDIYVGFRYFCTDRQTTEGATNGIEIIHKGNDVWVDALGRVVS